MSAIRDKIVVVVLSALLIDGPFVEVPLAQGQSYNSGLSKYQQGDFKGAIKTLQAAARKRGGNKAEIYKLIGICQYMLSNKSGAAQSFKTAIKINSRLSISAEEVLDPTVIGFFNGQKSAGSRSVAKRSAPKKSQVAPSARRPTKSTFLSVKSNVNAQIFIEGILAGNANSLIETDPGLVVIEVSAAGYKKRLLKVKIAANRENIVSGNLAKIVKPKPKPKPVPRRPKPPPQRVAKPSRPQGGDGGLRSAAPYTPAADEDGLFADDPPTGGAPSDSRNLAGEFAAESSGYAPQPPQMAPYGQPLPPPVYQPQPYYQQPPPPVYYGAPPPQPLPPPLPPPPPPPLPPQQYESYPEQDYDEPLPPRDPPPRRRPKRKSRSKSRGSSNSSGGGANMLISLLPFGAGQFQNDKPLFGVALAGGQAFALYFWYSKDKLANDTVANTQKYIGGTDYDKLDAEEQEVYNKYLADTKKFVDDQRQSAQLGLAGFGVLWAAGVIEAIINKPTARKSKRRSRKYRGFGLLQGDSELLAHEDRHYESEFRYGLSVAPRILSPTNDANSARRHGGWQETILLNGKWTFGKPGKKP